jgi:hypothetical protein
VPLRRTAAQSCVSLESGGCTAANQSRTAALYSLNKMTPGSTRVI